MVDYVVNHVVDYVADHVVNYQNRGDFFIGWTITVHSLYIRCGGIFPHQFPIMLQMAITLTIQVQMG